MNRRPAVLARSLVLVPVLLFAGRAAPQTTAFPALSAPRFVEAEPGRWAAFPGLASALTARDRGFELRSRDGRRSVAVELPGSWIVRPSGTVATRFTRIDPQGTRSLRAAPELVFEAPDGAASLTMRALDPATLELTWRGDPAASLAGVGLRVRGGSEAARSELLTALNASSSGAARAWRPHAPHADLYRLDAAGSSAAPSQVLVQKLVFGTFLGGNRSDGIFALALAASGDVIAAGGSNSLDFPSDPDAYDPVGDLASDASVLGLSRDGSSLLFATFFGGTEREFFRQLVVEDDGTLLVSGKTESSDLPTTPGAFDTTWNGFENNPFVARFTADGSALLQSTYIGGSDFVDAIGDLIVDPADHSVLLAGGTCNADWPTTPGTLLPTSPGGCDGFVTRLSSDLSTVLASTLFGSISSEQGVRAALAADGSLLIAGRMPLSGGEPYTPVGVPFTLLGRGAFPDAEPDDLDYLVNLSSDLSTVHWATWVSGGLVPYPLPDGSIVLLGRIRNPDFPTTEGAFATEPVGPSTEFEYAACKLSGNAEELIWSTYVPADGETYGIRSAAIDDEGRIFFCSAISTTAYPFTPDAFDTTLTGFSEPQLTVLNATGSQVLFASLIGVGGGSTETDIYLALDGCGGAFVAGETFTPSWPVTPGAFDETYGGFGDAWLVRMTALSPWTHLGGDLAGGKPRAPALAASGPLCGGDPTSLDITCGPAGGSAFLVIGFSELSAPFKGGTLIPAPDFVKALALDGVGARHLSLDWPPGLPSDLQLWLQAWIPDPAGPAGFSATNGVLASTP